MIATDKIKTKEQKNNNKINKKVSNKAKKIRIEV
jgi:hypothetical protein